MRDTKRSLIAGIVGLVALIGLAITAPQMPIAAQTVTYGPYASGTKAIVGKIAADQHIPVQIEQPRGWQPMGFAVYTATTAKSLSSACGGASCVTLPATAKHAIISIDGAPIRWRDDGVNPTATVGHKYAPGTPIVIAESHEWLAAFRWIDTADGASTVTVTYYKNLGE